MSASALTQEKLKGFNLQQYLTFHERPSVGTIGLASGSLALQELDYPKPAKLIYDHLRKLQTTPNWSDLKNDPVLAASSSLSLPLLYSLYQIPNTELYAGIVLSQDKRLIESEREKYRADTQESLDGIAKPREQWGRLEEVVNDLAKDQRYQFIFLTANKLCEQAGYDVETQFLQPLKLIEMQLAYDPHVASLHSRAAGTQIPFSIRAFTGRLRLARKAIAQDSMVSALIQEYGHVFTAHAFFMNVIREEFEKDLGIKLELTRNAFTLREGQIDISQLEQLPTSNQLIQALLQIVSRDYNTKEDDERPYDLLGIEGINDLESLYDFANSLSILMVDPSINESIVSMPMLESAMTDGVQIPPGGLYRYNQNHLLLRMGIRDRYKL